MLRKCIYNYPLSTNCPTTITNRVQHARTREQVINTRYGIVHTVCMLHVYACTRFGEIVDLPCFVYPHIMTPSSKSCILCAHSCWLMPVYQCIFNVHSIVHDCVYIDILGICVWLSPNECLHSRCLASHQYQLSSCNSFCIVVMICNYSKHPTTKTNQKNHVIYDVSTCCVNKTHIFAFVSAIHRFRIRIANQKYTHVLIM